MQTNGVLHFSFFSKSNTECGLQASESLDYTHKDMRKVTCQECRATKEYLEALRIWDAGYYSGYNNALNCSDE
jgi:hypothetical protein